MGKRILLTTTGSLGDLHPFIAIGLELLRRGHSVTLATSNFYRAKVERTGLRFAPMGPHLALETSGMMERIIDLKNGPEYLVRRVLYPSVPAAYSEVMEAARACDCIVTHPVAFAAQIVAEKTGMPWISTITTPLSFWSRFDPSVIAPSVGDQTKSLRPGLLWNGQEAWPGQNQALACAHHSLSRLGRVAAGERSHFRRTTLSSARAGTVFLADGSAATRLAGANHRHGVSVL